MRQPADPGRALELAPTPPGFVGPAIRLQLGYRTPLVFLPYFEAGGRRDGNWRRNNQGRKP